MKDEKNTIIKENDRLEDNELNKKEKLEQIKKWFNWILIVAGFYFVATGYYGAFMPLRKKGIDAINGIVIFTGIIAIVGIILIILGCRNFIKTNRINKNGY